VQEILRDPNELELEKVYCPYFLYSKKRYAARKWTLESDGTLESSVDVKGLQLVRRDTCPFVRSICKKVLDSILESPDPRPVITMVRCARDLLLSGEVPMEELTLTRSLADEYKSQNLAHVKVRDKIRERTPGSEPKSGDRIPFVLLVTDKKQKAAYEKAEDPEWVREHGLVLDYQHYFKNHMKKPVTDLLEPIIDAKDLWGV
jgi:DNA polymerase delta subunit 1